MALDMLPDNFSVNMLTLNSNVAISLASTYAGGLKADFFCVGAQLTVAMTGSVADNDAVMVLLGTGAVTIGEVASAIGDSSQADPWDATNKDNKATIANIIHKSIRIMGTQDRRIQEYIPMPGKGIILREDKGISLFAFNPGANDFTTGTLLSGLVTYFGRFIDG